MAIVAHPQGYGHHVVAAVHIPFLRIIRKLEEGPVAEAGSQLRVGDGADAIRPEAEDEIMLLRHQRNPTQTRQIDHRSVRLQHVEAARDDQDRGIRQLPWSSQRPRRAHPCFRVAFACPHDRCDAAALRSNRPRATPAVRGADGAPWIVGQVEVKGTRVWDRR
jgi:hypothetical protein